MSRIALLIRTHVLDDQVRAFVETMRRDPVFDLFAVVDESRGRIDFGDIPKIPLTPDLPAELGLYGQAPNLFWRCGGYPPIALMEDIALSQRLRRWSRPLCLTPPVITSGRRWERRGVWRTMALMWWLRLRYFLGASPARLRRLYEGERS